MIVNKLSEHNLFSFFSKTILAQFKNILNPKRYQEFLKLKNIHQGKRAFIVGSGPSLKISDLNDLKGEITFACNKIYLSFNDTKWRPTYYTVLDSMVAKNCKSEIKQLKLKKIFSSGVKQSFPQSTDILWINDLPPLLIEGKRKFQFSKNLAEGAHGGFTVIYTMLQIAYYMGISEVYLLGIDFSFDTPKPNGQRSPRGEILITCEGESNHFHPNYRKKGEQWTMPKLDLQYEAFKEAKRAFEDSGRIIYNASRTTKLDIFPLIDFDQIIMGKIGNH